jgi:predicted nucleotidyltransferase
VAKKYAVLQVLLSSVRTILGSHFIGMYLEGSLTSDDFDQASDIDFVVVTEPETSQRTPMLPYILRAAKMS